MCHAAPSKVPLITPATLDSPIPRGGKEGKTERERGSGKGKERETKRGSERRKCRRRREGTIEITVGGETQTV